MRSTEKKYYKIKEVSEMLDIPISTLHFWEKILHNRKNVSKRQEVAERLEEIKTELQSLADALDGIWKRGRENNPVSE